MITGVLLRSIQVRHVAWLDFNSVLVDYYSLDVFKYFRRFDHLKCQREKNNHQVLHRAGQRGAHVRRLAQMPPTIVISTSETSTQSEDTVGP